MHGGGDYVVARLAVVDVVVGMHRSRADLFAEKLCGAVGDHFIGIHVGAGAGAGLVDIEHKLIVQGPDHDLAGGCGDGFSPFAIKQVQSAVGAGGLLLDHAQGLNKRP